MKNIQVVESTGAGKAVKGAKITSSFQVRHYCLKDGGYLLIATIRFKVGDSASKARAKAKAAFLAGFKCKCGMPAAKESFDGSGLWFCDSCFSDFTTASKFVGRLTT